MRIVLMVEPLCVDAMEQHALLGMEEFRVCMISVVGNRAAFESANSIDD
jgi:hypothetical protein